MADLFNNEDLLLRYLDGELSEEERQELEVRIRTDAALQLELEKLQLATYAIKQYGVRQKVGSLHKEMMQELRKRPTAKVRSLSKPVRAMMAVAASILLLFMGVKLYLASQVSSEDVYNESFVDFKLAGTRGDTDHVSIIEKAYQKRDYQSVVQQTRSVHMDAKDSLLIGLSYLHIKQVTKAIPFFERLVGYDNYYRQDAEFYLSLSYIRNEAYDKALPIMKAIAADSSHLYHQQLSTSLVDKVKDLKK